LDDCIIRRKPESETKREMEKTEKQTNKINKRKEYALTRVSQA
jgi:hypothetical protein